MTRWMMTLVVGSLVAGCGPANEWTVQNQEERLTDVENRLGALEGADPTGTTTGTIPTTGGALAARVSALEAELTALQAAIDGDLGNVEADVADLQADMGDLGVALNGLAADLAASRAGASVLALGNVVSIAGLDNTTLYQAGSHTVNAPGPGRLIAILSGTSVFFGKGRTFEIGLGDTNGAMDSSATVGHLDGTGGERFYSSYSVIGQWDVNAAGPFTVYAMAQGNTVFDAVSVNVTPKSLTVLFVPDGI